MEIGQTFQNTSINFWLALLQNEITSHGCMVVEGSNATGNDHCSDCGSGQTITMLVVDYLDYIQAISMAKTLQFRHVEFYQKMR